MLTVGALLLCSVLLAFAALSRICNRPVPPRWTKRPGVAELLTMIFSTLIILGLGSLGAGVGMVGAYEGSINPVDLGMVALVLTGTAFLLRWLSARDRAARPTAAAPVVTVPSAAGEASVITAGSLPAQPSPAERVA
jgi:hypothetical protein